MELQDVKSASISKLGYDPNTKVMIVVFNNGSTYEFSNVDFDSYQKLFSSPSIGKFFSKNIKTNFPCKKIN